MYTLTIQTGQVTRDSDGVVVAPCDSPLETNFVEYHDWVAAGNEPTIVSLPQEIQKITRLSKLDYMNRFTDEELAAIFTAAKTNVLVEIWLAKFNATTPEADGTSIDLTDARLLQGLDALEAAGILSAGRAQEITN